MQVRVVNEATGALLTEETLQVTPEEEGIRLRLNIDLEEEDRLRVLVSVVLLENDVVLFRGLLRHGTRPGAAPPAGMFP